MGVRVPLAERGSVYPRASPGAGELLTHLCSQGFGSSACFYVEIITAQSHKHHTYPGSAAALAEFENIPRRALLSESLNCAQITFSLGSKLPESFLFLLLFLGAAGSSSFLPSWHVIPLGGETGTRPLLADARGVPGLGERILKICCMSKEVQLQVPPPFSSSALLSC